MEFYRAKEGSSTEKLFWSQYAGAEHPMPLSDQVKQLVELHRAAEVAMKDFIVRMWPGEPLPTSYFGLIKRMVNACPRLEVIKRSVCIEGARRAFSPCEGALGQAGCGEAGEGRAAGGQGALLSRKIL